MLVVEVRSVKIFTSSLGKERNQDDQKICLYPYSFCVCFIQSLAIPILRIKKIRKYLKALQNQDVILIQKRE